jgi:predicted MPP superfamily phosphohydrolase
MSAKTLSRRQFLMLAGGLALNGAAAGLSIELYASRVEPFWIQVRHIAMHLPGLPQEFENFTIAQFSDLHAGAYTRIEDVRHCVAMTNALGADAIVLTGDFVTRDSDVSIAWAPELALLKAKYGVFAVLGNHDTWSDPERIAAELAGAGAQVLRNESTALEIGQSRLWLVGVEDIGYKGMRLDDFKKANKRTVTELGVILAGLPPSDPHILLVHNPDFTELLPEGRVDLALCGHTHGGQVHLPFFGSPIVPSFYGQKYTNGLVRGPKTLVYINRGIGVIYPPLRFNCRPEITLFRLRS